MDKLVIDIGNTSTKIAIFRNKELLRVQTYQQFDKHALQMLFNFYPTITHSIISSVAETPAFLEPYLSKYTKLVRWDASHLLPMHVAYRDLHSLGQDRLAIAKASAALYPNKEVLSIALGTCITYNFVDKENVFYGGAISPGLKMRYKALNYYTHALPLLDVQIEKINDLIGLTTQDSIQIGVLKSVWYELEGNIAAYTRKFPKIVTIITGGDANYFEMSLKNRIFALPNLVLIGLNEILDLNVSKT
ncbi:MAG: type III pantothenate kinase [Bacteroidales bacterium]